MVDIRNLEAIERLRYKKLSKEIEEHTLNWIKRGKCMHNQELKGRRRDYIRNRMHPCKCIQIDREKKFGREIQRQFNTALKLGTVALENTLGRKLPEMREAIIKGNY